MKFSSLQECPPPLEPKCVVQITALALPTGEDLTRYTRHLLFYHIAAFSVSERFITSIDNASFFLRYFSVVTEAADANQPEGKKEDEDTSASSS